MMPFSHGISLAADLWLLYNEPMEVWAITEFRPLAGTFIIYVSL
jgi:hypothetical protein